MPVKKSKLKTVRENYWIKSQNYQTKIVNYETKS